MMQTVQTSNIGNTFIINSKMTQADYGELRDAAGTQKLTPQEATDLVCAQFGFDASKVAIEDKAELNVYVTPGSTKPAGACIPRPPLYNATDWHYIRFRVCGILWECVDDSLEQIAE